MIEQHTQLGKLQAIHPIAPAYMQRAAAVAILAFIFFVLMLIGFSIRQNFGYFLLATAFLIVELFTLFGWLSLRKVQVKIFENGFSYKKFICPWSEIKLIETKDSGKLSSIITKQNGEKVTLTDSIYDVRNVIKIIEGKRGVAA